jgi:hypothetical protein
VPAPWLSVLTKAQRNLGASILFNLYVAEHPRNTSKNIISVLILSQIYFKAHFCLSAIKSWTKRRQALARGICSTR